jgi:adenosylcobinamide-phosphate synthase
MPLNRSVLLAASYLVDQIAGDPEWFPHPVRLIGMAIARGEVALRRPHQSDAAELTSGAVLTVAVVAATYYGTRLTIRRAYRRAQALGYFTEILLGWTCLAARDLRREATAVTDALTSGDINTLDSMIGHADSRYFYFGKAAARLDDAANYLPARLTAAGIVAASHVLDEADPLSSRQIWRRDGAKHKSPNAGQPESAMAGALRVRLGGDNTYAGERIPTQILGREFPAPAREHAGRAIRLVSVVALLGVGFGVLLTALGQTRRAG